MATIIIQGSKEETAKAQNVLRDCFGVFNKKAAVNNVNGVTAIIEAYSEPGVKEELSEEQILKSLECCSNKERNCAKCFFRDIDDCEAQLKLEGAIVISKLLNNVGKPEGGK